MLEFKYIQEANNLPQDWDNLAENYFQQKKMLQHIEKYNPCHQRYYLCFEDQKLVASAIVYSLRLDIFTYIRIKSPIKMNIIGIPCSVSSSGIFGNSSKIQELKNHIYKSERGFSLCLNLKEKPTSTKFAFGNTLPTIIISNRYKNWEEYLTALRSSYRRRLKRINKSISNLKIEKKSCSNFTMEMYFQYLEVYKRSSGKLERLSVDFFKNLSDDFILTICSMQETVIGWNIALADKNIYYFFLGGIDYKWNKKYDTYFRLLSSIVKDGIEQNAEIIELGQTAEIAKMRMGGNPESRFMEAHHNSNIINKVLKISSSSLSYKRKLENTNAFKEQMA